MSTRLIGSVLTGVDADSRAWTTSVGAEPRQDRDTASCQAFSGDCHSAFPGGRPAASAKPPGCSPPVSRGRTERLASPRSLQRRGRLEAARRGGGGKAAARGGPRRPELGGGAQGASSAGRAPEHAPVATRPRLLRNPCPGSPCPPPPPKGAGSERRLHQAPKSHLHLTSFPLILG
ncbi:proline-rich proteoglycan 2-like [Peromyscus californicus insignis]|uniref:proline-rich proteoglycan 2-like n=1 Tax=Peromyscus californicus insignis TaxID=564181 RepID=UPI0022A68FE9|nr:proline-rich proteoglycan 2-like [Peromyscus californicus insignis]